MVNKKDKQLTFKEYRGKYVLKLYYKYDIAYEEKFTKISRCSPFQSILGQLILGWYGDIPIKLHHKKD